MHSPRLASIAGVAVTLLVFGGSAVAIASADYSPVTPASKSSTATDTPSAAAGVGSEQAAAIALQTVGGGTVTGVEQEAEHGVAEWSVEVTREARQYEVRVDDVTGAVTRTEVDGRATAQQPTGATVTPAPHREGEHPESGEAERTEDRHADEQHAEDHAGEDSPEGDRH